MEYLIALFIIAGHSVVLLITTHTLFRILVAQLAEEELSNAHPHHIIWVISLQSVLISQIIRSETFIVNECFFGQILELEIRVLDLTLRAVPLKWSNVR